MNSDQGLFTQYNQSKRNLVMNENFKEKQNLIVRQIAILIEVVRVNVNYSADTAEIANKKIGELIGELKTEDQ